MRDLANHFGFLIFIWLALSNLQGSANAQIPKAEDIGPKAPANNGNTTEANQICAGTKYPSPSFSAFQICVVSAKVPEFLRLLVPLVSVYSFLSDPTPIGRIFHLQLSLFAPSPLRFRSLKAQE